MKVDKWREYFRISKMQLIISSCILVFSVMMGMLMVETYAKKDKLNRDPFNPVNQVEVKVIRRAQLEISIPLIEDHIRDLEEIENRTAEQQKKLDELRQELADQRAEYAQLEQDVDRLAKEIMNNF